MEFKKGCEVILCMDCGQWTYKADKQEKCVYCDSTSTHLATVIKVNK